ncbi:MAG: S49 family peptidase, partial [Burkholderiaceae bacterium]
MTQEDTRPMDFDAAPAASTVKASATSAPAAAGFEPVMEQFARDYLRERRSERRWRTFFRLSWLLLLAVVAWGL